MSSSSLGIRFYFYYFFPEDQGLSITCPFTSHFSFSSFGQEKESRWPASGRATFAAEWLSFHISREIYGTLKGIQFPACPRDQITKLRGVQPQLAAGSGWEAAAATAAKSLQSCPTLRPHRRQPTRLLCPWDSPGKNTGVGCHFLLQCIKVKSKWSRSVTSDS